MADFSRPITYESPDFMDKDRKEKFVDNLKGYGYVKVAPSLCDGAMFTICNTATGEIQSVTKINGKWCMWGSTGLTFTMSDNELEDYLSEQIKIANSLKKTIRVMDEFGCLEWRN